MNEKTPKARRKGQPHFRVVAIFYDKNDTQLGGAFVSLLQINALEFRERLLVQKGSKEPQSLSLDFHCGLPSDLPDKLSKIELVIVDSSGNHLELWRLDNCKVKELKPAATDWDGWYSSACPATLRFTYKGTFTILFPARIGPWMDLFTNSAKNQVSIE